MRRRTFLAGLGTVLVTPLAVWAQQAGKVYRIGYLGYPCRLKPCMSAHRF
jgi:hypothetical protein